MEQDPEIMDVVAELNKRSDDPVSKRAAEEIVRLRGIIERNCDPTRAASVKDRTVIEAIQRTRA
jgi:hypothetical protein